MDDFSAEKISELRQSLEFDRDRVGMPGCDIRRRATWLLAMMDRIIELEALVKAVKEEK